MIVARFRTASSAARIRVDFREKSSIHLSRGAVARTSIPKSRALLIPEAENSLWFSPSGEITFAEFRLRAECDHQNATTQGTLTLWSDQRPFFVGFFVDTA
jgi:hypothetical protein